MLLSRNKFQNKLTSFYNSPQSLKQEVENSVECPDNITAWLGKLKLLYGVPINYLVPDEGMLPSESIRFFYLDANWIDALVDGAFSIGRNLAVKEVTTSLKMDTAAAPMVGNESEDSAAGLRAGFLGVSTPPVSFRTISGFILRSSLVINYKGMGFNPYPKDGTPDQKDPAKVVLLKILRMERLGPDSDTLICLVEGDIFRVDIHEAPEALHYGIDSYSYKDKVASGTKTIYPFTKTGDPKNPSVTMDMKDPRHLDLGKAGCFRTDKDPRTVNMKVLADLIAAEQKPKLATIDASEMGFEMIEGVGMVSFYKK